MPTPKKEEKREDFLHRYMADAEARKDHPEEKQRFAAATSIWDHRESLAAANNLGYNSEKEGAELFHGRHLQPGLVRYEEITNPVTQKKGVTILVTKEAIDSMRHTMKGVPLVNWEHVRTDPDWLANGKACGIVVGSYWNPEDGWDHVDFFAWDKEAKANSKNGFKLSCMWIGDEVNWTAGLHNNLPYDGTLVKGHYNHLAVVTNPRYEGAVIYANSIGETIMKLFGFGKPDGVELDKAAPIEVNGKKHTAQEVVEALNAIETAKTTIKAPAALKDDDSIELNGKTYTGLEVRNALVKLATSKTEAEEKAKKEAELAAENAAGKGALSGEEIDKRITAGIKKGLEDLKGDTFFNAVAKLAELRPETKDEKPRKHKTEADRVAEGAARYGKKEPAGSKQ